MPNDFSEIIDIGSGYFGSEGVDVIKSLPILKSDAGNINFDLIDINLPIWGTTCFPDTSVKVYKHCLNNEESNSWDSVDWFRFAWELATSSYERKYENDNGVIHSYYQEGLNIQHVGFAFVNRLFLFFRKWAVVHFSLTSELQTFGSLPKPKVILTHDVDYVSKTLPLILKNLAFCTYSFLSSIVTLDINLLKSVTRKFSNTLSSRGDYWQFEIIQNLENKYGAKSYWNFYSKNEGNKRSIKQWLFDPSYNIESKEIKAKMDELASTGHTIGLHQSFESWNDDTLMRYEKDSLEVALGRKISTCRQHWLKFSFKETWLIQERCGFNLDTTLGFNNVIGFRNSFAWEMPAYISTERRFSTTLKCLPMVLMDSHLYDYSSMSKIERRSEIDSMLDELEFVGGTASIIWHQRVFHSDYGWGEDYEYLLGELSKRDML